MGSRYTTKMLLQQITINQGTDPRVALFLHGVFNTQEEAASQSRRVLSEEEGTFSTVIVDTTHSWLPVSCQINDDLNPSSLESIAHDIEDVSAPENADSQRAGSVCDLPGQKDRTEPSQKLKEPVNPFVIDQSAKTREVRTQREQLDALLSDNLPTTDNYADYRMVHATLFAFLRKLRRLKAEAVQKETAIQRLLADAEKDHPEYSTQYKDLYTKTLKESGIPREKVELFEYID